MNIYTRIVFRSIRVHLFEVIRVYIYDLNIIQHGLPYRPMHRFLLQQTSYTESNKRTSED